MNIETSADKKSEKIPFNLDSTDLDDFNFKPVNEGLGFHHGNKKSDLSFSAPKKMHKSGPSIITTNARHAKTQNSLQAMDVFSKDGLGSFYADGKKDFIKDSVPANKISLKIKPQLAPLNIKFSAWLIDTTLILLFNFLALIIISLGTDVNLKEFYSSFMLSHIILITAFMFGISYVMFFTILDIGGTPGKLLMKIELRSLKNSRLSVGQTILRSLISLLSFIIFGIPAIFDFQGKLTDTVVENK